MEKIDNLLDEAIKLALEYIEQEARRIMRVHPRLKEFVMAMGSATFIYTDKYGHKQHMSIDEKVYLRKLCDFIDRYDRNLYLTGNPMRFTVDGPKITDW